MPLCDISFTLIGGNPRARSGGPGRGNARCGEEILANYPHQEMPGFPTAYE